MNMRLRYPEDLHPSVIFDALDGHFESLLKRALTKLQQTAIVSPFI
jgi:hypothetical protein